MKTTFKYNYLKVVIQGFVIQNKNKYIFVLNY